jgi:xanthine dehydrogenase accessory factor
VSELRVLLQAIERFSGASVRLAIATIVDVHGSTYRRPGAKLLVPEAGATVGTISGGCLEGDVAEVALSVIRDATPRVRTWDLTTDDDGQWGLGLGCNGAIEVLVEPLHEASQMIGALRSAVDLRRPSSLVTVLDSRDPEHAAGATVFVPLDEPGPQQTSGHATLEEQAAVAARRQFDEGRSGVQHLEGGIRAFVDVLAPPPTALICGAGQDASALVDAASGLGWRVVVADERVAALDSGRFTAAAALVCPERPELVAAAASVDPWTFAVVMSHQFERDKAHVRALLGSPAPYIAVLGPAARTKRLTTELVADGVAVGEAERRRLHGPAGLDIGAEGPHEIAAAICAEIIAVQRGRGGGFLRDAAQEASWDSVPDRVPGHPFDEVRPTSAGRG